MLRFQEGDGAAFDRLYARHRGPLYRYFARQAARGHVDDLFQETWLRVIRGKRRYRPDGSFAAYLFRIGHNVLVDYYRREANPARPAATENVDPPDPGPGPDAQYAAGELRAAIACALTEMPAAQREAWVLHQDGGLTLEQIGAIVGAGRETVKSRLRYAADRLRRALPKGRPARMRRA
jgi:RNA polymerase sigma-70 factor (ECF subfamily)